MVPFDKSTTPLDCDAALSRMSRFATNLPTGAGSPFSLRSLRHPTTVRIWPAEPGPVEEAGTPVQVGLQKRTKSQASSCRDQRKKGGCGATAPACPARGLERSGDERTSLTESDRDSDRTTCVTWTLLIYHLISVSRGPRESVKGKSMEITEIT